MSLKMKPQAQQNNPHVTITAEVVSRVFTFPGQLIAGSHHLRKHHPKPNPNGIPSLAQGCEERSALEKLNPNGIPSLAQGCEERATLGKRFEMPPNPKGVASPRFRNLPKPPLISLALAALWLLLLSTLNPQPSTSHAATLTVTNTSDSGAGSLRQAILTANSTANVPDTINFNISGAGPHTINPATPLPNLTDPVTINGYSQSGSSTNNLAQGDNAILKIIVLGTLIFDTTNSTVRGLALRGIDLGTAPGPKGGNVVEGNFIGLDDSGTNSLNSTRGVFVQTPGNRIGGSSPGARNVISAQATTAIEIFEAFASNNVVMGNYIGTDRTGTKAIGNGDRSLVVNMNASSNAIGGTISGAGNLISGNLNRGITLDGANNLVRGNFIGTDVTGLNPLGNARTGVEISGPGNTVGGTIPGAGNVIAFNGVNGEGIFTTNGVDVAPGTTGFAILGNSIFDNLGLGIDVNANKEPTAGFPVLSLATNNSFGTIIQGKHTPNTSFRLELFSNFSPDPSGYGEGRTLLASIPTATDGGGNFLFNQVSPLTPGLFVTATADGATEFSRAIMVVDAGGPNSWTNVAGGKWETAANWSLRSAPYIGQSLILITNTGTKSVTNDAVTALNFPTTLTISNLTISAPTGATNTLLLTHGGTLTPLTVSNNCSINAGGSLALQNAGLKVKGPFGTGLRIDGSASLAGGLIEVPNDGTRLIVGNNGRGLFTVTDGSVLVNYSIVGANDDSDGTWRISGGTNVVAGGAFDIADSLTATGTVVVTGGRLEMPNAYVGLFGNGRLFISNGVVQCAGTALIGSQDGSQGSLIAAGGVSSFGGMQIRESSLAAGSVLVTGNAQVQVNGPLDNRGSVSVAGGSLNVLGLLESEQPGNSISVTGGQFAVTNDNAMLTSMSVSNGTFLARDIFLGNQKVGNFSLAAGIVALSGSFNGFNIGVNGGTGVVSQTGGQIIAPNTDLNIGGLFGPATGLLSISNGTASVQTVYVGGQGGGTGAVVMAGGMLSSGSFYLGSSSVRNQLIASNGAAIFTTGDGFIGFDTGAHSNSAALSGPATRWSISSNLYVGNLGAFNRLAVNGGAGVVSSNAFLGFDLLSISNTALVAGPGSTWSNTGDLFIGWNGRGNQLLVTNGGKVWNRDSELGRNGSSNNFVLLSGAGSMWSNAGIILLGRSGFANQIVVTNGAVLWCSGANFGVSTSSRSNRVVVAGSGSAWSNSSYLSLGEDSAGNSLVVTNGGVVACANCTMASGTPSGSNDAVLVGPGSLFAVSNELVVGHQGRANRLTVTDGAEVFVGRGLTLGNHPTATNNRIEINGGTLRAPSAGTFGGFDVRRGTNVINSGLIDVALFRCTNTLGFFEFNGGTLATGTTTNNNGRLFTVGNGTSPATLQLNGGTHVFANNLLLSSNANLTGAGTIIGAVTNVGTISPGASAGRISITGPLVLSNRSDLRFEIGGTVSGSQYDQITISNTITHAGTVNVQFINGFTPSPGQVFQLLTAPSRAGTFANISLPVLPTGYVWTNRLTVDGSVSVGALVTPTQLINPQVLANGSFQFAFTNLPGLSFNILTTTNLAQPIGNWTVLGQATELTPGQYRFTDLAATNQTQRFYRVRWP